jgi:hypothetical protein
VPGPDGYFTQLLGHWAVNRATGFASAFTNPRTGECCDDKNALLAAILADATNLGQGRIAVGQIVVYDSAEAECEIG